MDFDTLSVNVVIPAAGSGERFNNSQLPKQFVEICGKPLICYAVEGFLRFAFNMHVNIFVSLLQIFFITEYIGLNV